MLLRKGNALILLITLLALFALSTLYNHAFPSASAPSLSSPPPSGDAPFSYDDDDRSSASPIHVDDGGPKNERIRILPIDLGKSTPKVLGEQDDNDIVFVSSDPEELPAPPPSVPLPTHPLLRASLKAFLARPILTHEQALKHNVGRCPVEVHERQVNPDQLRGERDGWAAVGVEEIQMRREGLVRGLEGVERRGGGSRYWDGGGKKGGGGKGRGVVVAGGNQDTTARLLTLLRILRKHNSTLPVEVFHFQGEITDQGERDEIKNLGGTLKEFQGANKEIGVWKNFQIKALSILQSSFSEVLYLDSDNLPLRDPAHLFDSPSYTQNGQGAVFWPDLNKDHPENAIFRVLGEECVHDEWQIDSGQMLIDKRGNAGLNLAALHLAAHMQKDHDFWFSLSGGDKDTFRYAFHILGLPFATPPAWLASLGTLNPYDGGRFCGSSMVQFSLPPSPPSQPLFVHANLLKHTAGLSRGGTFTHLKSVRPSIRTNSQGVREGLDQARGYVYDGPGRGMCVDLEVMDGGEKGGGGAEVVTREWKDVSGGWAGLEDAFWEEGGKVGGW